MIPESLVEKLKKEVNNPDLWKISRFFQSVTFFFYTDDQIKENTINGLKEVITKKYFELLKQYDEFDYFKKDNFSVSFDSKENFDNNYQSNWYYYYK